MFFDCCADDKRIETQWQQSITFIFKYIIRCEYNTLLWNIIVLPCIHYSVDNIQWSMTAWWYIFKTRIPNIFFRLNPFFCGNRYFNITFPATDKIQFDLEGKSGSRRINYKRTSNKIGQQQPWASVVRTFAFPWTLQYLFNY